MERREKTTPNLHQQEKDHRDVPHYAKPFLGCIVRDYDADEFEAQILPTESLITLKQVKVLSISTGTTFQIGNNGTINLRSQVSRSNL
ncbi:hypothetical protein [Paenibacillus crassostreae]|nr:hypothetical protein [Paenibacillus crassostreae]